MTISNVTSIFGNTSTAGAPTETIDQDDLERSVVAVQEQPETTTQTTSTVYQDYTGKPQSMFTVEQSDLTSRFGLVSGKKGLFVDSKNINIVSDKYEIVQPSTVLARFEQVAEQSNLDITDRKSVV